MESSNNIRVLCRIRPPSENELKEGYHSCLKVDNNTIYTNSKSFTFDHVSDETSNQAEIFEKVGKPITDTCLKGYNGTIFAYGQTGSGKTHTVQGKSTKGSERGLMPRVFEYLCDSIAHEERKSGDTKYTLKGSFLEIYNDHIYDLLTSDSVALNLREDQKRGVFVDGQTEELITGPADALKLLERGQASRRVAETAMNRESSRSHCVFSLSLTSKKTSEDGLTTERFARFNLIDLAGSERQKMTNTSGLRLKEASRINASLSALGNVIMSLVDIARSGKNRHVHYRDSKLTFLLQDSLGGNSLTYIVGCLSPAEINFAETVSTLKFVQRAKFIKNNAKVNEDQSGGVVVLKKECESLKQRIRELESMQNANSRRLTMGFRSTTLAPNLTGSLPQQLLVEEHNDTKTSPETLLLDSLQREKRWQGEIFQLKARLAKATEVVQSFEKQQQSNAMVIKMRDRTIQQYSQEIKSKIPIKSENSLLNEQIKSLQEECSELRKQLANNPQVARADAQIQAYKDRLQAMQAQQKQGGVSLMDASKLLAITTELTKLREEHNSLLRTNQELLEKMASPGELLAKMSTPEKRKFESFELEKWKAEQNFNSQLQQAHDERDDALAEVSKAEAENARLETLIQEALMLIEEQKTRAESVELRNQQILTKMKEDFAEREREGKEIFTRQLQRMEDGIQQSESAKHTSLLGLAQVQADLETVECARNKLSEEVDTKGKEIAALQQQLEEEKKNHTTSVKHLLLSQQKVEEIKASLAECNAALTDTKAGLKDTASFKLKIEAELVETKSALEEQSSLVTKLQEQCSELKSQLETKTSELASKVNELDKAIFNHKMVEEDQECLMEDMQVKDARMTELKKKVAAQEFQLSASSEKILQIESELLDKTEQLVAKENQVTALMDSSSQLQSLKETLETLEQEKADLTQKANRLNQQFSLEEKRSSELQFRLNIAETGATKLQEDFESVSDALKSMHARFASLVSQSSAQHDELKASQLLCQEQVEKLEAMSDARADAETRLIETQDLLEENESRSFRQIEYLKKELKDRSESLEAVKHTLAAKKDELISLNKTVDTLAADLSQKVAEMQGKAETLATHILRLESQNQVIEAKLASAQEELNAANTDRKRLETDLTEKQSALDMSAQERERLKARVASLQTVIAEAVGEDSFVGEDAAVGAVQVKLKQLRTQLLASQEAVESFKCAEQTALAEAKSAETNHRIALFTAEQRIENAELSLMKSQNRATELHESNEKMKNELDTSEKLISKWESLCSERQAKIEELKTRIQEAEAEALEHNALIEKDRQLEETLVAKESAFELIKTDLERRLAATDELMQQHAADADAQTFEAARLNNQVEELKSQLDASIKQKVGWLEDVQRLQLEEENTFQDNQALKQQMELMQARLEKASALEVEVKQLREDVAKLTGHQNARQKIQHHMKIKLENDGLKLKIGILEKELWKHKKALGSIGTAASDKENVAELDSFEAHTALVKNQEVLRNHLSDLTTALAELAGRRTTADSNQLLGDQKKVLQVSTTQESSVPSKETFPISKNLFEESQRWMEVLISKTKEEQTRMQSLERQVAQRDRQVRLLEKQVGLIREQELLKDTMDFGER
eukprot:gb/GEZN01000301.1/.p1 GENE.gb/GEZN01000301.1/~~gb/GEZN01000301.1/.p1  ORF type:complete len:1631 (-),score=341.13 gb/GEZN01000301.1/:204-5063(-)